MPNGLIEDGKLGGKNGTPPWRQYYNTRNHLWLALNRKYLVIFKGWLIREIKYTLSIILSGDKKIIRLVFKLRAIRDAFLNKRGKRNKQTNERKNLERRERKKERVKE